MSLAVLADHMASKGRNGDTMLVHMTPEEVRGLHALAAAHGGELTINPETGLPEANFLKRLLPTIIGFGISVASGGTIDPMTAAALVGGVETVRTGDLGKGISAGLGAYGGASFGAGLSTTGSTALAGSPEAIAAGQTAAGSITPEMIAASNAALADAGMGASVTEASLREAAAREAARDYASNLGMSDKVSAGLRGLTEKGGRDAFMDAMGGGRGLFKVGYMAAAPLLAAEATKAKMPQTVTSPTAAIDFLTLPGGRQGDYGTLQGRRYTPEEFARLGGFQGMRERLARGEEIPPPGAASGGLMGMATGGVAFESGTTPSYQRTSMSPGMLDFADRSEPVVRMADGGVTPDQLKAQQSILADPQAAALAAAKSGIAAGLTNQQIADQVNAQYGKNFSAQNVADFMAANQLTRPAPPPASAPAAGLQAAAASIAPPTTITSTDPTQRALPTAAQYAAQQSIVADPQAAALSAARSGIAAGMTDQQIADMVNMQYGKTFSAQNVADFMRANNLTRPKSVLPPEVPDIPVTPPPTLFPGTTPGVVSTGEPFQPKAQTMEQVRSAYVQGGGRTDMPTITNIQPTDRTYTYNEAFGLLQGYLKANPNAMYRDVVAFARSKGIPEMQAKAAYNEFRFSGLTGGSQQAYDYLMGRGAAPTKPFVTGGGSISRSYADAMGITGGYQNLKPISFTKDQSAVASGVPKEVPTVKDPKGNRYSDFVSFYFDANPDVKEEFESKVKDMTPEDYVQFHYREFGSKPNEKRKGYYEQLIAKPATYESGGASGGMARDIPRMARGGLSSLAILGAAGGGQFDLGSYSDGGRLLRGPGDGVSDSIPATIGGKRPARLADGEFVVPARIVSELGNGSTEAGARKLYAMMDRVQAARRKSVGKGKVAKNTRADKYLPA